jgi:hypothetical protein
MTLPTVCCHWLKYADEPFNGSLDDDGGYGVVLDEGT